MFKPEFNSGLNMLSTMYYFLQSTTLKNRFGSSIFLFFVKMSEITRRMDKLLGEQEGRIQSMQGSSARQMEDIDARIKVLCSNVCV